MGDVVRPSGVVTFLFTDIEGSTRRWEDDPDEMRDALATHDQVLRSAIEVNGGWLFKHTGDGVCASFGSPVAAVGAAALAQRDLAEVDWGSQPLRVRMGLHTGEALETADDYFGPTLNRAARLMSAANGGQVLLSEVTARLLIDAPGSAVHLTDLGVHALPDIREPERVHQLGDAVFSPIRCSRADIPNNLPKERSSFIGRTEELALVRSSLETSGLVTITGMGGAGKTRLALRSAAILMNDYPAGVQLVGLAEVEDSSVVAEMISTIFTEGRLSASGQTEQVDFSPLSGFLANRPGLLILDNCEHLIAKVASVVTQLLVQCPTLSILATSREPLGVASERVLPVPPLSAPSLPHSDVADTMAYESCRLLVDRCSAVDPHFSVDGGDAVPIAEICQRLGGIPLALELVAPRVVSLSASEVARHLDDQLRLLGGNERRAVDRHRTLRATLEWSYELLSPESRDLLARLSVFRGGWTTDAAQEVMTRETERFAVLENLNELADKSLIFLDHETARFGMIEPIRQYAAEVLAKTGREEDARDRHARWAHGLLGVTSLREATERLSSPERYEDQIAESANVSATLAWLISQGNALSAAEILAGSVYSYVLTGRYHEALTTYDTIRASPDCPCWCAYFLMTQAGFWTMWTGDTDDAVVRGQLAVELAAECPDVDSPYLASMTRGTVAVKPGAFGRLGNLRGEVETALHDAEAAGDHAHAQMALFILGSSDAVDRLDGAVELIESAYRAFADRPLVWVPYAAGILAYYKALENPTKAIAVVEEAEQLARALHDPMALTLALRARAASDPQGSGRAAIAESARIVQRYGLAPMALLDGAAHIARTSEDPAILAELLGALSNWIDDVEVLANGRTWTDYAIGRLGDQHFHELHDRGAETRPVDIVGRLPELPTPALAPPDTELTTRQLEVAQLVARGLSNRDIAERLEISPYTVETHVRNILDRLDATSRTQIVAWVKDNGHG